MPEETTTADEQRKPPKLLPIIMPQLKELSVVPTEQVRVEHPNRFLTVAEAKEHANIILISGLYLPEAERKKPGKMEELVCKILAGQELGLGPHAAVKGLYIVNNQIGMSVAVAGALLEQNRIYGVPQWDDQTNPTSCSVTFFSPWKPSETFIFTMADAARASLLFKDNWKKYPADMLYARAYMKGARKYAPACLMGFGYTPEELEDVNKPTMKDTIKRLEEDGKVTNVQTTENNLPAPPAPVEKPKAQVIDSEDFRAKHPILFKKYGDMLTECWIHKVPWTVTINTQYGTEQRSHQIEGGYCNYKEQIMVFVDPLCRLLYVKPDEIVTGKELGMRMNVPIKAKYEGRTYSKLTPIEQCDWWESKLLELEEP